MGYSKTVEVEVDLDDFDDDDLIDALITSAIQALGEETR